MPPTGQKCAPPMHYRLRPIERRQQESWNFISHFMHIQIFQMEISSLSLILTAPKYSRQICRGRNKHILISLFNFTAKCKKKRDKLNSVKYFTQKTGAHIFAKHSLKHMVYIFIVQKILAQQGRLQPFFYIFCNFGEVIHFFLW